MLMEIRSRKSRMDRRNILMDTRRTVRLSVSTARSMATSRTIVPIKQDFVV
jgi:hypothetical protein